MVNPYTLLFTDFTNPIYRYLGQPFPLTEYFLEVSENSISAERNIAILDYAYNSKEVHKLL